MTEHEQDPPHRLDYLNPKPSGKGPPPSFDDGRFLLGLGVGVAASALIWFNFFPFINTRTRSSESLFVFMVLAVPCAKVILSIVLIIWPGWRSCGFGLLISIPVGVLLFFGACAVNLKGL